MLTNEEMIQNLLISEHIDEWLERRNFNSFEANLAPMIVSNKKLWEKIQENPLMSEKEFIKIAKELEKETN